MDLTIMTPQQIDTLISNIYDRYNKLAADYAREAAEARRLAKVSYASAADAAAYYNMRADKLRAQAQEVLAETEPYENEYRRRSGWLRYFLVVSSGNGHLHSSRACSTCRPSTRYAWKPEVSGKTFDEMVAMLQGEAYRLCTVCFPDAPVDPFGDVRVADGKCMGRPAAGQGRKMYQKCADCNYVGKAVTWRKHKAK